MLRGETPNMAFGIEQSLKKKKLGQYSHNMSNFET